MLKWMIAGGALTLSTGLPAAEPCPVFKPGQAYPWQKPGQLMVGDQWAYLYIDLDKKGRPKNCRVGNINMGRRWASGSAGR